MHQKEIEIEREKNHSVMHFQNTFSCVMFFHERTFFRPDEVFNDTKKADRNFIKTLKRSSV
jgi:hypothetical protein